MLVDAERNWHIGGGDPYAFSWSLDDIEVAGDATSVTDEPVGAPMCTLPLCGPFDPLILSEARGARSSHAYMRVADRAGCGVIVERQSRWLRAGKNRLFELSLACPLQGVLPWATKRTNVDLADTTHVGFATVNDNFISTPVPVRVEPDVLHVAMARLSLKFGDDAGLLPVAMK